MDYQTLAATRACPVYSLCEMALLSRLSSVDGQATLRKNGSTEAIRDLARCT